MQWVCHTKIRFSLQYLYRKKKTGEDRISIRWKYVYIYMCIFVFIRERIDTREKGSYLKIRVVIRTVATLDEERLLLNRGSILAARRALGRFSTSHLATDLWAATWPRYARYTSVDPRAAISPVSVSLGFYSVLGCEMRLWRRLFYHISFSFLASDLTTCFHRVRVRAQILIIVRDIRTAPFGVEQPRSWIAISHEGHESRDNYLQTRLTKTKRCCFFFGFSR